MNVFTLGFVAAVLIVLSVVPVWLAQRVAGPAAGAGR